MIHLWAALVGPCHTSVTLTEVQFVTPGNRLDTARARERAAHQDDCTAFVVPDCVAGGAGFVGQTWEMHDSATDHVVLARLHPDASPAALVFTTVGCLGQIGMNEAGVCVGINNLSGTDGRFGVTWSFVVREMLACNSADTALDVLRRADLAGAHNYLILDAGGAGYNVEAMPSLLHKQRLSREPLVHTNHVTDPTTEPFECELEVDSYKGSCKRLTVSHRDARGE